MAGLRELAPDAEFHGIGGPLMQAQGMTSLFPMRALSVMGLVEVLPRYFQLRRLMKRAADAAVAVAPDALITIDAPDFCLRVARAVRRRSPQVRTMHYVAPSVWAWRPGRAARMAQFIDHVLALLPFEPELMTAAGMSCDFVGHPAAAEPVATPADAAAFRIAHGIGPEAPLIMALPGSRRNEVRRLLPPFGESLQCLAAMFPALRIVLPTPVHLVDDVAPAVADWPGRPLVLAAPDQATRIAAFAAADAALAASGTVSLELAAQGCPMVIAYDMAPLTLWLMKRLVRVDTVTLVNLVAESRTVPEFIGPALVPQGVARALGALLAGEDTAQKEAMALAMARLGRGGEAPGLRAARSVLAHL